MKCRLTGFGDRKDLLGNLNPASASSGLAPRVMSWTLRKKQAAKSFVKPITLVPGEKWKSPNIINGFQVMECQENLIVSSVLISLPNLHEEPSPECQGTVHHLGMQLGIVQHLDSIGIRNGECTPPGQHWDRESHVSCEEGPWNQPALTPTQVTAHLRKLRNAVVCVFLMGMES